MLGAPAARGHHALALRARVQATFGWSMWASHGPCGNSQGCAYWGGLVVRAGISVCLLFGLWAVEGDRPLSMTGVRPSPLPQGNAYSLSLSSLPALHRFSLFQWPSLHAVIAVLVAPPRV